MDRHVVQGRYKLIILLLIMLTLSGCSDVARQTEGETPASEAPGPAPVMQPEAPEETPVPSPTPAPSHDSGGRFPGYRLEWTETTRSPISLYESGGLAAGKKLYVFGGYYNRAIQATTKSYAFEPAQERWYNLTPMPEAVTHAGQALYGGKIYLAGGYLGNHPGPPTDHVWIYDIATDSWSAGPNLPEAVGGGALVEVAGRLHFFGGAVRKGSRYVKDSSHHWVLDVAGGASSWTDAAPLPRPRNHLAGATVGGKIYAIGGQLLGDENTGNTQTVEAYDPQTDSWQEVAALPKPLGHISAATFGYGGRIIVVMGVTQARAKLRDIIAYNPETNAWQGLTSMPGGRSATVAGVIDGKIVLATGTVGGRPLDTTWVAAWK